MKTFGSLLTVLAMFALCVGCGDSTADNAEDTVESAADDVGDAADDAADAVEDAADDATE